MVQVSCFFLTCHSPLAHGSDGMYGNFAGRDASRGMAKQSFDEGELIMSLITRELNSRHAHRYQ
jgi:hypothetical protein